MSADLGRQLQVSYRDDGVRREGVAEEVLSTRLQSMPTTCKTSPVPLIQAPSSEVANPSFFDKESPSYWICGEMRHRACECRQISLGEVGARSSRTG